MKTTYTVPEVPGSKRQSARPYTHALIGFFDAAHSAASMRARHEADRAQNPRWDTQSWQAFKRESEATVGQMYSNHNGYRVVARDYNVKSGQEFMAKYPTVESYLAHLESEFEQSLQQQLAKGNGPVVVLRWSMSAANAAKGSSEFEFSYCGLRVVECVPVGK